MTAGFAVALGIILGVLNVFIRDIGHIVPILLQVYFNSSLVYGLMKLFHVPHSVAAPGALIGASNFFELAVATAIVLSGPSSGAALATVVLMGRENHDRQFHSGH